MTTDFIHFSQISTYLKCKKRHDFSYIERLEPRGFNPKMMFGTFGHAVLADAWRKGFAHLGPAGPSEYANILAKVLEEHPECAPELMQIAHDAKEVALRAYEMLRVRFDPIMVEKSLLTEINVFAVDDPVQVGGTPDLVAKDLEDGSVWVLDYKFRESFMAPETELLNLQMIFYQALLAKHGIETCGSRQIQIRPYLPKQPKVNKDGSLSRADCMTDWATYKGAIQRLGLKVEDYAEMEEKLAGKVFVDIDSCRALRSPAEVDYFWTLEVHPAVVEIVDDVHTGPRRCFDQMTCRMCPFQELCVEEAKGGDLEFLKLNSFRHKDKKEDPQYELVEDTHD